MKEYYEEIQGNGQDVLTGYASLTNDYMFKRVFGSEECKDILIQFLNDIVAGPTIVDVKIQNAENLGPTSNDRKAVFDIYCSAVDSSEFIVEMQCAPQEYFRDRSLFYTSYPIIRQAARAKKSYQDEHGNTVGFRWDFNLKPVTFVGITDFAISHGAEWPQGRYRSQYLIREKDTGELFGDKLQFIFLELARFDRSEEELGNVTDKWMYLFRNLPKLKSRPAAFDEKTFERLFDVAEFSNFTAEQFESYKRAEKMKYDYQNTIDYAEKKGWLRGKEEGKEEGSQVKALEIARNLKALGVDVSVIMQASGLTEEQIAALE